MNNFRKYFSPLGFAIVVLSLLSSCKEDLKDIFDGKDNDEPKPKKIQFINNDEFGYILTDQNNQSLYFFAGDVSGVSNCNGGCADVWPSLIGDISDFKIDSNYKGDFGTTTREDGELQITYKGWPLYYFSPEADGVLEAPGETQGDGRGGVFHIAKPDYTVLLGRQAVEEGGEPVTYLVDDRGVSLYRNVGDDENVSNCAGGCAGVWPPFKASESWVFPSSLSQNDFDTVVREDDLGPQLSYLGSPLYFFTPDEGIRGNVLGQEGGPNGTFFVVEPAQ
ncbi:MAG: hypothetical protein RIG62_03195 [Cyclobacteriaceae bacterium]